MKKFIFVAILASILSACSSVPLEEKKEVPVVDMSSNKDMVMVDKSPSSSAVAPVNAGTQYDSNGLPKELTDAGSILSTRVIYFDFDEFVIKPEYRDLVVAHGKFMTNNKAFSVMLQGHSDERGSSEYNLALGQKRSEAVLKALNNLGVSNNQVEAVSYGEEKPEDERSNEDAWAKNRRVEILYKSPSGKGEF